MCKFDYKLMRVVSVDRARAVVKELQTASRVHSEFYSNVKLPCIFLINMVVFAVSATSVQGLFHNIEPYREPYTLNAGRCWPL